MGNWGRANEKGFSFSFSVLRQALIIKMSFEKSLQLQKLTSEIRDFSLNSKRMVGGWILT